MLDLIMIGNGIRICDGDALAIWQFIGWILLAFRIIIPLLLIIFGMIDLGKAVVAAKDDEIKKSTSSLVKRAIAGIAIFFIPTLIRIVFAAVTVGNEADEWDRCINCLTRPGSSYCDH